jgi:hypothetical protein
MIPQTYYHPLMETRNSTVAGYGSFATGFIKAGERVIEWGGTPDQIIPNDEFERDFPTGRFKPETVIPYDKNHQWVQFADDPDDNDALINHSCDPNLWFDGWALIARRDIKSGEELTFDYATGSTHPLSSECCCGSRICRGKVSGNEYKDDDFQKRFQGHFCPYMNEVIQDFLSENK